MKVDRLLAILTILSRNGQVTAPELAARLEVTRRTISRDIDALCKAGIPIVTKQGAGGGISIAEGYTLDKSIFTRYELSLILAGLRGLQSVNAGNPGYLLEKLLPKGDAFYTGPESVVIDLASNYQGSLSQKIALLKDAIESHTTVSFEYYSSSGTGTRRVEPCRVLFKWTDWYLQGFCLDKQDFRVFKLNRLWRLQNTETPFRPRPLPPEHQQVGAYLTDHIIMEILFDPWTEFLLVESYGPSCYTVQPDGKLLFRRGYTNLDHIVRWVLGFGSGAEVLSPPELREAVARHLKDGEKNIRSNQTGHIDVLFFLLY